MYNGSTKYALANQYNGWHMFEWYFQLESSSGAGNGLFKGWVDGVLINSWNNLNYGVSGGAHFDIWSFIPYWGGGGASPTSNQYICVSRQLVACA
jgi:hypothetical protein